MTTFRWLHFTDLHHGMPGQKSLWPNVEEMFLEDLDLLRTQVGPWDLVLFTGDITQRGTKAEFAEVDKLLGKFWSRFTHWGLTPKLLAIPGNHDLIRPTDETDPALVTLVHTWQLPAVQRPFWENENSPQRNLISNAFQGFSEWWENTPLPKPTGLKPGLLPGDWSASFPLDGFSVGIVGLNSAYLQLAGGDFEGRLHLDVRQFHAACDGHGADWTKRHDACLLLTHHPVHWLSDDAQKHFANEIHYPPERFALHLFGHMHEANLTSVAHGGGGERRRLQGCSLFGLETWGENQRQREHGYSLCELKLEQGELRLRIWPRRAIIKPGGGRKLERDLLSFDLNEHDGGTKPVVIKKLERPSAIPSVPAAAPSLPLDPAPTYDPRKPPFYVPFSPKGDQVIGRETALGKVREQLTAGRRTAIGQAAVFQGLGGLGKTQLAVEYVYRYREEYPNGVIWLTADQDIDAQLVDLAVKACWVAPESEHKFKLEIARHRLRSVSGCLIVFDNLEQMSAIEGYLPEPPAEPHILATSRTEQPDFNFVPIDVLDPDQSFRMLIQEARRQPDCDADREAARQIATALGGLPLALELAGAYLSRRPVGWRDYLDLLQHNLKQALPQRLSSLTRHEADLYSTLQISEEVFAEEPRLRDILDMLAWSAPAPMRLELLAMLLDTEDRTDLTGALGLGAALRILQQPPGTDSYAIHRLVREVRREERPLADRSTRAEALCQRIGDWFDALREDFRHLPQFESEIDHLRQWHEHALSFAPQHASRLTWLQVYPPFLRGQPQEIKRHIELALNEYQEHKCDDRPLLARLYNDLAYSIDALGDPRRALDLTEQALAIRRELFGERHPDTAISLNNVAAIHDALGNPRRALDLTEQALVIQRELFGERHPNTANYLGNLSSYHNALGNPRRALELAEQALVIQRELSGERHPFMATSLNNLARYHNALGNPQRALELAEQALAIQRELFGERHPDTATSLHNMATYLLALGRTQQAHAMAMKAWEINKQMRVPNHPSTRETLGLLGRIPGFRAPSQQGQGRKKQKRK